MRLSLEALTCCTPSIARAVSRPRRRSSVAFPRRSPTQSKSWRRTRI